MVQLQAIGNNIGSLQAQQNITLSSPLIYGPVVLGSVTDLSPSFTENPESFMGCMRTVYINGAAINLDVNVSCALTDAQYVTPGCPREENCYPDPCANDGECMSTWNEFSCSCRTDFTGTNCSERKLTTRIVPTALLY